MTNVDLPINATESHVIITEYFIDQKKYLYLILLHVNGVICIGTLIMLAIGTMLITYLQHICGMFKIARYECGHNNLNCYIKLNFIQHILKKI